MGEDVKISNAIIKSAELTTEDHGCLTAWLDLDYGGRGQGFGAYMLTNSPDSPHWPGKANFAGVFIRRVMDIADVRRWSQLPGRTIRAQHTWTEILAIGHIVRDEWFWPKTEFDALRHKAGDA